MPPTAHLAAINFFTGDIQGGLGPFLSTWLAETGHWSPARVGLITTLVGLGGMLLNGPAGWLADQTRQPRLLLGLSCGAILAGTALLVPSQATIAVLAAQLLAAGGGTLLLPTLTLLTLGIVGKCGFPKQQARNQAFNHAGIVSAAALIYVLSSMLGGVTPFIVLGGMALAAILAVATTPGASFNGRRAHGWHEDEPDEQEHRCSMRDLFRHRSLLLLAVVLATFNLSSGSMLSLVSQRLVANGHDANQWTAIYVVTAQMTMIPVALWAGSLADQRGRRHLLLLACLAQPVRAVLCASVTDPLWLMPAEVLDGIASGLLGVATPVLAADLTWGTGRTQTALGGLNTMQGAGGALSGVLGGLMAGWLGWSGTFLVLLVPALAAVAMAWRLEETREAETGNVARAHRAVRAPAE
jgi:MFS family permease